LELLSIYYLVIFLILLILSAFFSASETAYFSLSSTDLQRMKNKSDFNSKQVVQLLSHPKKLLITVVVGNTLVNIGAASLAAIITLDICDRLGLDPTLGVIIDVIIVTFVILICTEIIPKVAAVKNAIRVSRSFSLPLTIFYYIFLPLVSIFHTFTHWLTSIFRVSKSKLLLSEDELRSIVDMGEEKGTLQQDEKEMIHSIFEFSETIVREIMIPRIDMICISTASKLDSLLNLIKKNLHSRIPLYKDKVDNIVGIVYAKDLLPFVNRKSESDFVLEKLARPAYFVPEQKKIDELLREFQTERIHMAIVVDEYGGTAGLVTLEDIIEEIVGEIQDEHDSEQPLYQKVGENEYLVDGGMDLEELNEELDLRLPTEEGVETIAGFLFGLFGSVPKEKQSVSYQEYKFIVEKVFRRRIKKIRIIKEKIPPKN
jgi:gliding motility-associated protein GldE